MHVQTRTGLLGEDQEGHLSDNCVLMHMQALKCKIGHDSSVTVAVLKRFV